MMKVPDDVILSVQVLAGLHRWYENSISTSEGISNLINVPMFPYLHSMMLYVHAEMVVFSDHAQDVLLFCAHACWVDGLSMPTDGCYAHAH